MTTVFYHWNQIPEAQPACDVRTDAGTYLRVKIGDLTIFCTLNQALNLRDAIANNQDLGKYESVSEAENAGCLCPIGQACPVHG